MVTLVRAAALTNFSEVAQSLGLDPRMALADARLHPSLLRQPEQRIAAEAAAALLESAARTSGCESFGLRMTLSRSLSDLGVLSLLLTHQASLRDVLAVLVEHLHLLNESLALSIEYDGPYVIVREELMAGRSARQSTELAIGVLYRLCATLMGERWQPVSVNFSHHAPADMRVHRQVFRCHLAFDSEFNGIVCRTADLDVRNPAADPALARYARQLVDAAPAAGQPSVAQQVRKAVYLMLPTGRVTCTWVAQSLGRSGRTLQRQLEEEGTSFTQLLDEVRRNLAQRHVHNPRHSLGQVAALLGYSTHAAFTRWFVAQFGHAPAVERRCR